MAEFVIEYVDGERVKREMTAAEVAARTAEKPTKWRVDFLTFLDRLTDANADAVVAWLDSQNAKLRERIRREGVWSDNAAVRNRLVAMGEDPDVVLAL